jgi:hypothetical protein
LTFCGNLCKNFFFSKMTNLNFIHISLFMGFLTLMPLKGMAVGEAPLSSPKEASMAQTSAILFGIQMMRQLGAPLMRELFTAGQAEASSLQGFVSFTAGQAEASSLQGFVRRVFEQGLPLWRGPLPSEEATPLVEEPIEPNAPVALAHHGQVEVEMPTDEHNCFFFSILAYLRVALSSQAFSQFLNHWNIDPGHPREGFMRLLVAMLTDPQVPENVRQAIRRNILLQMVRDREHLVFGVWLNEHFPRLCDGQFNFNDFNDQSTRFLNNAIANILLRVYLEKYLGQRVAGTDAYPMIAVEVGFNFAMAGIAPAIVEALGQAIRRQIPTFRLWMGGRWATYEPVERFTTDEGIHIEERRLPNLQMIHTVADPTLRGQPGANRNHFNLLASPYEAAVLRHVEAEYNWRINAIARADAVIKESYSLINKNWKYSLGNVWTLNGLLSWTLKEKEEENIDGSLVRSPALIWNQDIQPDLKKAIESLLTKNGILMECLTAARIVRIQIIINLLGTKKTLELVHLLRNRHKSEFDFMNALPWAFHSRVKDCKGEGIHFYSFLNVPEYVFWKPNGPDHNHNVVRLSDGNYLGFAPEFFTEPKTFEELEQYLYDRLVDTQFVPEEAVARHQEYMRSVTFGQFQSLRRLYQSQIGYYRIDLEALRRFIEKGEL